MTKCIERYPKALNIVQYCNITNNDELSLQGVSNPVIDFPKETKYLLKTDLLEMRRPWFPDHENHEKISKPLFVTLSKEGVVFAT